MVQYYFCSKCKRYHRSDSRIGIRHKEFGRKTIIIKRLPAEFKCPICGGPLFLKEAEGPPPLRGCPLIACENWGNCYSPWSIPPDNKVPWHVWPTLYGQPKEPNEEENLKRQQWFWDFYKVCSRKYPEILDLIDYCMKSFIQKVKQKPQ